MNDLLAAAAPLFSTAFTVGAVVVTWLEGVAFVLAIVMVVCNIRVNPIGWPLAIASSLLYFLLFWNSRLYGDAVLQLFFVAVAGWGWWQWLRGTDGRGRVLVVRELGAKGRALAIAAALAAWPLAGAFLARYTDSDVPWWDAFPTAASVVGQFLLGRKYVENWPMWLVVNVVGASLFAWKGLWLTTLLYGIFALMSLAGWRAWLALRGRRDAAEAGARANA